MSCISSALRMDLKEMGTIGGRSQILRGSDLTFNVSYDNNVLHGPYAVFHCNDLLIRCTYRNGQKHGLYEQWFEYSGRLRYHCHYNQDKLYGEFHEWDEEGNLINHCFYDEIDDITTSPISIDIKCTPSFWPQVCRQTKTLKKRKNMLQIATEYFNIQTVKN